MGFGLSIICLVFASLNFARFASVQNIQTANQDLYDELGRGDLEYNVYDTACLSSSLGGIPEDKRREATGYYTVWKYAEDECNDNEDCWKRGTQWSHLFIANGMLYLLYSINMLIVGIGAWKPMARVIGAAMAPFMWCFNIAMIITTGIYRFRAPGKLCNLSEAGTNAPGTDVEDWNDDWTYRKDGALIFSLWVISFGNCFMCFQHSTTPIRTAS